MKKRIIATTIAMAIGGSMSMAQEIATWSGDRKGAVSFTFDDGAPSHVSDAGPMFDNYGYKATFNLVTNWNPNWEGFQGLADNGHEIASHSKTHNQGMSGEEASSKADISQKNHTKVRMPHRSIPHKMAGKYRSRNIPGM